MVLYLFLPFAVIFIVYLSLLRPRQLRWGASNAEIARGMPGDDVVDAPTFNATRAITIEAQPEHIYPWIAQIGVTRAGWYSYDLLDNLGKPSAEDILSQFQQVTPGDLVPMSPDGKHGLYVLAFAPNRWMLWWDKAGRSTWIWGLYPVDDYHTRVVTRVHMKYRWFSTSILFALLVEFADIFMMRKCLLGIKRRAERLANESTIASALDTLLPV